MRDITFVQFSNFMISKSSRLHLRIPFSIFLLPVFVFALSQSRDADYLSIILMFIALHLFVYPASNGFNSFYDKDEKSIGGLKYPPKVDKNLLFTSLIFDLIGLAISIYISIYFAIAILIYGLVSKAYSHPSIRLKKYPISGLLTVGVFQGGFIYLACIQVFDNLHLSQLTELRYLFPALISSVLLIGSYPMTQIYQHEEDQKRGDISISIKLGIRGTFLFTGIVFLMADLLFGLYFKMIGKINHFFILQAFLIPVLIYFQWWMLKVWRNPEEANFERTMRLNMLSSVSMILFFLALYYLNN